MSKRKVVRGPSRKQEIEETVAQYWAPSWVCVSTPWSLLSRTCLTWQSIVYDVPPLFC